MTCLSLSRIKACTVLVITTQFCYGNTQQKPLGTSYLGIKAMTYPFTLPELPYPYAALEPSIDEQTMRIHHTKHHQKYIDEVNAALAPHPHLHTMSLADLVTYYHRLPAEIQVKVKDNAGGHFNHSLFWLMMTPQATEKPQDFLYNAITQTFGSFDAFKEQFNTAAKTVFGSGWAWLCVTPQKTLKIIATHNQDSPLAQGLTPILGLDVWEHAYYLKYQNKRPDYISAWWQVINWNYVQELYRLAIL